MDKRVLLTALGCGRLPGILEIAAKHSFVVFGTMEGEVLDGLMARAPEGAASPVPVYFYESG